MIAKWFPWKWMITRAARSYGLLDPFTFLARLRKFAEPSEVDFPLELVRAWTVFQARGVVNTRAIQHNLDWVWPYWVERQFNPRDASFIPRSFSFSHINLTHRNWTAVCVPDADVYALVDPRGLVTPLHDGWSLDAWIVSDQARLVPGRCKDARQIMRYVGELAIETDVCGNGWRLASRAEMKRDGEKRLVLHIDWKAEADPAAMLCISLRPYNPEGIQFIDSVKILEEKPGWLVNGETSVLFDCDPYRYAASTYEAGDVFNRMSEYDADAAVECPVGMATAAALFPIGEDGTGRISVTIPLDEMSGHGHPGNHHSRPGTSWQTLDDSCPRLELPDERMTYLYYAAARTLLSLSAGEVFPGSYTYRRFWFRDACIMLNALLALNQDECCQRAFEYSFLRRQTLRGFFQSQQGEWDSNGQVLWLAGQYLSMTGKVLSPRVLAALKKGADWLCRKRLSTRSDQPHAGLLPPGFSAEHLGPNNYYYWDNFWGLAGLQTAGSIFLRSGEVDYANKLKSTADEYNRCILTSISASAERCGGALPAAPGRRLDGGAIGSIVADYPLQLFGPGDPRIMKTVEFLLSRCMIDNGFFHDMTHSGINPYLTLYLAQVLLRAGDLRYVPLIRRVAELASPTGQWPEAVHPLTGGGCMGDGQHGWAAAEWVLMIRNLFIREEKDRLVIGSGLLPEWLQPGTTLCFGPTATSFGRVTVRVKNGHGSPHVEVSGDWRGQVPAIEIAVPGRPDSTVSIGGSV
jgi:hypothetical protein